MIFLKLEQGWGYKPFRRKFGEASANSLFSKRAPLSAYRPKMQKGIKMIRAGRKL